MLSFLKGFSSYKDIDDDSETFDPYLDLPVIPKEPEELKYFIRDAVDKYVDNDGLYVSSAYKNDAQLRQGMDLKKDYESIKNRVKGYTGTTALAAHQIAHTFWMVAKDTYAKYKFTNDEINNFLDSARRLYTASLATGLDIHPGARISTGVFIDHGTGVVIGETAEVGSDTVMFHGVTLGAYLNPGETNTELLVHRHPQVGDKCVIGTGAKILGNIKIGNNVTICPNAILHGNNIMVNNSARIGSSAQISDGNTIAAHVKIGDGAIIPKNIGYIDNDIKDYHVAERVNGVVKGTQIAEGSHVAAYLKSHSKDSGVNGKKPNHSMDFARL